jgi:hypothetical protein
LDPGTQPGGQQLGSCQRRDKIEAIRRNDGQVSPDVPDNTPRRIGSARVALLEPTDPTSGFLQWDSRLFRSL